MTSRARKVCIVVSNRASYGRIKSVMAELRDRADCELLLIVGASALLHRFGKVIDIISQDGFEASAELYSIIEGENPTTMAKSTGVAIMELATLFENLRPDIVLTVADRFETMATAVAASYMNIPLAHTQGGEVTGSIDESVRHAVTKLAHVHFPATEQAARNVINMGEDPAMVFRSGCPALDAIANIDLSLPKDIFSRYGGAGPVLDPGKPYLVVLQHPVTTEYGQGFEQINCTLEAVSALDVQVVWLWPNIDAGSDDVSKGLRLHRERRQPANMAFFRNFSVEDYARLIKNCSCLVGNSSSAIREGSFLGVPAVNIGSRQRGREHGENVIHVDYDSRSIRDAIGRQTAHGPYERSDLFGDGRAGRRIADVLSRVDVGVQKSLFYGRAAGSGGKDAPAGGPARCS